MFVTVKGKPVKRAVTWGAVRQDDIEITRGLAPGEKVVVGPQKVLRSMRDAGKRR